jgi:hypothetical protein
MNTKTKTDKGNFYWLSFARPGETYIVIEEATTVREAIEKASPLKNFNPTQWSLQTFQIESDGEELKDFKLHTLITKPELIAKGYVKS